MPRARTTFHERAVGQVADRSGVAISALHFYERKGLIRSTRTASNHVGTAATHMLPGRLHPGVPARRHLANGEHRRP